MHTDFDINENSFGINISLHIKLFVWSSSWEEKNKIRGLIEKEILQAC